ncbi:hypothetical protein ACU686_11985 [Yinghuangia aomiensis]
MSRIPPGVDLDALAVTARRVLLDALDALEPHRDALVVVGAQAVHLRAAGWQLAGASYTSDGDLGLDPRGLAADPQLEEAMRKAGFELRAKDPGGVRRLPGIWERTETVGSVQAPVSVDLLVPASLGGRKGNGAQVVGHGRWAANQVAGLEPVLVDHDPMTVTSLAPAADPRRIDVNVAGPTALLCSKATKIAERLETPDRLRDKDAGDVLQIMVATDPEDAAERAARILEHPDSAAAAATGLARLRKLFGAPRSPASKWPSVPSPDPCLQPASAPSRPRSPTPSRVDDDE